MKITLATPLASGLLRGQWLHAGSAAEEPEPEPGPCCGSGTSHPQPPWLAHRERLGASELQGLTWALSTSPVIRSPWPDRHYQRSPPHGQGDPCTPSPLPSPHRKLSNTCLGPRKTSWRHGKSSESPEAIIASENTSQRQEGGAAGVHGGREAAVALPAPLSPRVQPKPPASPDEAWENRTNGRGKVKWCMPASGARVFSFMFKKKKKKLLAKVSFG